MHNQGTVEVFFQNTAVSFTVKCDSKMQHNHVTASTGCLSGWWPGKYFTWRAEATDRCLSSNTAFIKASAGCEYRGSLCWYPPAAIKTAKSQAWEELADGVLRHHRPDPGRQQSALGVKPPHPLHTSLLSLSALWRLAFSPHCLPVHCSDCCCWAKTQSIQATWDDNP